MQIKNYYIIALYVLWSYVLLCVCIKLQKDSLKRKLEVKKKEQIRAFLSSETFYETKKREVRKIRQYSNDKMLFEYLCVQYLRERDKYLEKESFLYYNFIEDIIHRKIKKTSHKDVIGRCLLLRMIFICHIESTKINTFLMEFTQEKRLNNLLKSCEDRRNEISYRIDI